MDTIEFNYLITCVFTAVFGVFGIYHLASFLILRHKILLYYCILILALTLHWGWYILAKGPLSDEVADRASIISAMAAIYGLLMFTKNYLNIAKSNHPRLQKIYTPLKYVVVCLPLLYFLNFFTVKIDIVNDSLVMLAAVTAMVSIFLNIFSGIRLYAEEKFNKYYLFSYAPLLLSAIIYIGAWFLMKDYDIDIGLLLLTTSCLITLQLILFSILVGFKFKSIEKENLRTQVETNKLLANEVDRQTKQLQMAKEELETKNNELQTTNSLKNKLFSLLTHDVRGPLTNITALIEMIENQLEDGQLRELTKKLKKSVLDRIIMVNALLEWSYNQLEGIKVHQKNCDVQELFNSIVSEFERMAGNKKIRVRCYVHEPTLYIDENMFKVILRNLISNAIKFSNEGQEVHLSSKRNGPNIDIIVRDFGVGMQTDWCEKLENDTIPKIKLGTSGEKGTGFGLIIVKDFTEMNNGTLICESEIGQGTQFIMRFDMVKNR